MVNYLLIAITYERLRYRQMLRRISWRDKVKNLERLERCRRTSSTETLQERQWYTQDTYLEEVVRSLQS